MVTAVPDGQPTVTTGVMTVTKVTAVSDGLGSGGHEQSRVIVPRGVRTTP